MRTLIWFIKLKTLWKYFINKIKIKILIIFNILISNLIKNILIPGLIFKLHKHAISNYSIWKFWNFFKAMNSISNYIVWNILEFDLLDGF